MTLYREWYQIHEIFTSLQGEGIATGTPATFIRLQGCPVGCIWCDSGPLADDLLGRHTNGKTRNTWGQGGTRMLVDDILKQVDRELVIITGGEPVLWDLDALLIPLHQRGHTTQLETSGWGELKGKEIPRHITISPKERLQFRIPTYLGAMAAEIKWVVDDTLEYSIVANAWDKYKAMGISFVLMPEGCPPSKEHIAKTMEWIDRFAQHHPLETSEWLFGDRLQYRLGIR